MDNYQENKQVTVEDIDEMLKKVEKRAQSRPLYRFGVLALAVGIGSYLGVGRHVVKVGRDVAVLKKHSAAVGEFLVAQAELNDKAQVCTNVFDQFFGKKTA